MHTTYTHTYIHNIYFNKMYCSHEQTSKDRAIKSSCDKHISVHMWIVVQREGSVHPYHIWRRLCLTHARTRGDHIFAPSRLEIGSEGLWYPYPCMRMCPLVTCTSVDRYGRTMYAGLRASWVRRLWTEKKERLACIAWALHRSDCIGALKRCVYLAR